MSVQIDRIDCTVYRIPVRIPVATSFGIMKDRPAVFVKLSDRDGAIGWGEVFANWPAAGAEHRARLLIEDVSDLVLGRVCETPSDLFRNLSKETHIRALQCGEFGPFQQVIAGLDTALHDIFARREGLPLSRYLNKKAPSTVPAYASGIHISAHSKMIEEQRAAGHKAFKVKIGFDFENDARALENAAVELRAGERLFADANQAWTLTEALRFVESGKELGLGWLEEPIVADRPLTKWTKLATGSAIPLAAGENLAGFEEFSAAILSGALTYIQPDVAKWGGVTGCLAVGREAVDSGLTYCPHFLGGGIGLAASAHLLAAVGGDGLLEVDVNPNLLRDAFETSQRKVSNGVFRFADAPGLGIEDLPEELEPHQTLALTRSM